MFVVGKLINALPLYSFWNINKFIYNVLQTVGGTFNSNDRAVCQFKGVRSIVFKSSKVSAFFRGTFLKSGEPERVLQILYKSSYDW